MVTKAEVIELYLSDRIEAEKLLQLMLAVDTDNPGFQKNIENIQKHIALIDILIQRIAEGEPTQEDLNHLFNLTLSWGIDSNWTLEAQNQ